MINENDTTMTKPNQVFIVGAGYRMKNLCNDGEEDFKVLRRTTKTVTILSLTTGIKKTLRIKVYRGIERCQPHGNYSMSPMLGAHQIFSRGTAQDGEVIMRIL